VKKTWWDCVRGNMKSFGLSCKDAQDRDQWRLRMKAELGNLASAGKWLSKTVCICVCVLIGDYVSLLLIN